LPSGVPAGAPVASGRVLDLNAPEAAFWLQNMVWYHQFSPAEMAAATGAEEREIAKALKRLDIRTDNRPVRRADGPLRVLPYPGGRHPRIGFLEGAIQPQRETKLSVFTPWDDSSYVVADVPEAIWSNLGLTYLAHTHIDTIWDATNTVLEPLEWQRLENGGWRLERKLPNGIQFGTEAIPDKHAVRMRMWLTNGTSQKLTDLRVQNCVMLKGARGFTAQTNNNKRFVAPYAVCRSDNGERWIISAWVPNQRSWGNEQCPCLHSDPQFLDCDPGQTQTLRGWLSFYEGNDIEHELARITETGWQDEKPNRN
jgi:hypothetical protein